MPLNRHFMSAGVPASATEMTHFRREVRLLPPRAICVLLLLVLYSF